MEARHVIRLVAAGAAAVGLATGPASAKVRIPEEPEVTIGERVGPAEPAAAKRSASVRVVSVGWHDRYGLELYASEVDGRLGGFRLG